jgi:glycosyltransferase involved in cell wall biosynthesis
LSVLHVIPSVGPGSFGLGPVALNLALEQLRLGHSAEIWSVDTPEHKQWASETSGFPADMIKTFRTVGPSFLKYSPHMEHGIRQKHGQSFDVIHQHGIWTMLSRIASRCSQHSERPAIVTPHGSLEAWALRRSRLKKFLALSLYERRNLVETPCLHACSAQEAVGFRDYGLKNPVAVIPNGVSQEWIDSKGDALAFRNRYRIPEGRRIMLFLSRITPVKGLPMLLHAIKSMGDSASDWVFVMAGADEFNHLQEVDSIVGDLGLRKVVLFVGSLYGKDKRDAFDAAELFLLPTHRENYGIVVAEALGVGVPVITTKGAPWADLISYNCGWWSEVSVDGITAALREALPASQAELSAMGANGKQLVQKKYTWAKSAAMTIELYNWLINGGAHPQSVEIAPH